MWWPLNPNKSELCVIVKWFYSYSIDYFTHDLYLNAGILPDALKTECRKCSETQRRGSERVLKFIIENKPQQWTNLQRKYDPDNVYIKQANRLGIRVAQ